MFRQKSSRVRRAPALSRRSLSSIHQGRRRLTFETLEDRRLLAITVDTLSDVVNAGDGLTSLREAITLSNASAGADTITFTVAGTIALVDQLPTITDALTIAGANQITLNAGGGTNNTIGNGDGFRIFNIDDGNSGSQIAVTISGLTLTGGDVTGFGGAIRNAENLTLTGSTLSGNAASARGGGIVNYGTAAITNSTLSGNSAGRGGGVSNGGTAWITGSTLSGNSAGFGGGVYNDGTAVITGSTLSGNSANFGGGGGVYNGGVTLITNCTLSGNSAVAVGGVVGSGGAIRNAQNLTLTNSTLSGNSADFGGGVYNDNFGTATITNSLIASSVSGGDMDGLGSFSGSFNLVEDGSGSGLGGTITGDPLLGPLADNGGPTKTHALLPGSPAIGAGDPSIVFNPAEHDQRGAPFTRVHGGRIDIGAFEVQTLTFVVDTLSDVSDGDYGAGQFSLREAITQSNANPGADTITFTVAGTIALVDQLPTITDFLTIEGANQITLNAGGGTNNTIGNGDGFRIFDISDNNSDSQIDVAISGLTLTGGDVVGLGGAIRNFENLTLNNSTLSGNYATRGGGVSNLGMATITNSTLSGNLADFAGGGVDNRYFGPAVTITNSTLSGNSAKYGGGVYSFGTATITNSTLSGNSANSGGGVRNGGTATITGSLIANSVSGGDLFGSGSFSGSFNLVEDGSGSGLVGTITGDPLLGPLQDNGGPTKTHALLPGSPAIDAGGPTSLAFDQRSAPFVRVFGSAVDIGAFEVQPPPHTTFVVDTLSDVVNAGDGLTSLREAITLSNASAGADTITFTVGGTIALVDQLPTITDALTIAGTNQIILDAGDGTDNLFGTGDGFRHFNIDDGDSGSQIAVAISGLTLTGGDVVGFGGAISNAENLTLTGSTLSGNHATRGGGVSNGGTTTITSSTLSGNQAVFGGGVYNRYGSIAVTITNSTLSGNSANYGGGVRNGSTATITGSIIANSVPGGDLSGGGSFSGSFNLVEDGSGSGLVGTITGDPLLGPLADNGGQTQTHALLPGSPAIDAGDPSIVFNPAEHDQRGAPFTRVHGGRIDIGAVESQPMSSLLFGDYNQDGRVDAADYTVWRNTLGSTTDLRANGDDTGASAGVIDEADYAFWKANYGNSSPLGSGSLAIEPAVTSASLADEPIQVVSELEVTEVQSSVQPIPAAIQPLSSSTGLVFQTVVSRGRRLPVARHDHPAVAVSRDSGLVAWLAATSTERRRDSAATDWADVHRDSNCPESPDPFEYALDLAFASL